MLKAIIKASISFFVMNKEATRRCDELRVICYYDNHRNEQHPGKKFLNMRQDLTIR